MHEEVVKHPTVIGREIVLKGVKMTVWFWYYPGHDESDSDPGCPVEIEIESVWIDDFNVINLLGPSSILEIEEELMKLQDSRGRDVE